MRKAILAALLLAMVGCNSPPSRQAASSQPPPSTFALRKLQWSTLPASPLLTPSTGFTAAGRYVLEIDNGFGPGRPFGPGAVFDLATRTWHRMAPVPRSVNRVACPRAGKCDLYAFVPTTVWTGRQLFLTGGGSPWCTAGSPRDSGPVCVARAGLYDPATNRWSTTTLPRSMYLLAGEGGVAPTPDLSAAWTGRDVVLAGVTYFRSKLEVAAYNPVTGHWRMITPTLPAGHVPEVPTLLATSNRLLLWVQWSSSALNTSGVDVLALGADGRWRNVTDGWPQGNAGAVYVPLFTGSEILVRPSLYAIGPETWFYRGAFVNPVSLRRSIIPFSPLDNLYFPGYIWVGDMIVEVNALQGNPRDQVMAFDRANRRWIRLPTPPGRPELAAEPVWTGTELLFLSVSGRLLALHS